MGILSDAEIAVLIKGNPPLLEHLVDGKVQLQPAGVDLTLADVMEFSSEGSVDFSNEERILSECRRIGFKADWVGLKKGAYKVIYNETVRIPGIA